MPTKSATLEEPQPEAPERETAPGWSLPLHLLIGGLVVASMLALAALLMWQGWHAARAAMLAAASDSARDMGLLINEKTRRVLGPAEATLRHLSQDPLAAAVSLPQRLARLPVLTQVLVHDPLVSAVYVGYDNGEFLLVRALDQPAIRVQFQAPPRANFLVQSIVRESSGERIGRWHFYSADLVPLSVETKPEYRFDPRSRAWFESARSSDRQRLSEPYVFFSSRQVGLTLSQASLNGPAVLGLDVALADLGREIGDLRRTPRSEIALVDDRQSVLAYSDMERALRRDGDELHFQTLQGLGVPALSALHDIAASPGQAVSFRVAGEDWFGTRMALDSLPGRSIQIMLAVPDADLLGGIRRGLERQAVWALGLLALLLPLGWLAGRQVGLSLNRLTLLAQQFTRFDFDRHPSGRSVVREVKELDAVFGNMCLTIQNFLRTTEVISSEPRMDRMLEGVLTELVTTTQCRSGAVYLCDEPRGDMALSAVSADGHGGAPAAFAPRLPADHGEELQPGPGRLTLRLVGRQQQPLGLLVLDHAADDQHESIDFRAFAVKLSGALAVSVETRHLFEAQQRLLDAVIQLLADAIDAKSPYTGGHCERVPVLAEMLIDRLCDEAEGPYAGFAMSETQRYEFHLGAWLHDCGKLTSPEHVIDKSTKLEALYNRMHEIRTRFEVLWRDAQIEHLQRLARGEDAAQLDAWLSGRQQALQDDHAFVAGCNIGGESMDEADVQRLQTIARQTWWRHFDSRLGTSAEERLRMAGRPAEALPVLEPLLADRPEHLVAWGARRPPVEAGDPANRWGFDMKLPAHARNMGELHNLSVRRGTLTAEDRFLVNDHIVQTLIMLRSLPWPAHLSRVPDIAATHHERLDGRGYPRALAAERLTLADRVMALADIFEALTAADRPYKAAKTLTESLRLMAAMARERHLDAELFRYFLHSRLWLEFARKYLQPAQIDEVDLAAIEALLPPTAAVPA